MEKRKEKEGSYAIRHLSFFKVYLRISQEKTKIPFLTQNLTGPIDINHVKFDTVVDQKLQHVNIGKRGCRVE